MLVGVDLYENPQVPALTGCTNDVLAIRAAWTARGMARDRIRLLANGPASKRSGLRFEAPTLGNIRREFERLHRTVSAGDTIFFHFSGHGCRTPQRVRGPRNVESDQLDEVLLPSDTRRWNAGVGIVDQALVDDEIGELLARLRDRCHVLATFDCCYANTSTKGPGEDPEIQYRAVAMEALGIPDPDRSKSGSRYVPMSRRSGVRRKGNEGLLITHLVALYACGEDERAPELWLPDPSGRPQRHGALSWLLARALTDASVRTVADLYTAVIERRFAELPRHFNGQLSTLPKPILEDEGPGGSTIRLPPIKT